MSSYPLSQARNKAEKRRRALPGLVPSLAISAALSMASALTPVAATAEDTKPSYVNTQFVAETRAEASGRLVIRNTSILPRTVYARFEMPGDPGNRNYGFVRTIPALSSVAYDLPLGVKVFACDGKYWDDYRPDEAFAVTI
ncbi:MAG: hypothetical protein HRT64_07915, partial [Erythrobacter sp.]|nr:hypothetical protein [Erythrobacter sp.]